MKKVFLLLLVVIMLLMLVACNDSSNDFNPWDSGITDPDNNTTINTSKATPLAMQKAITIADTCEFYVEYADITEDVMPPQPNSWYSHYVAENGKVYIDICISYKNLDTKEIFADDVLDATLIFGGRYQYNGFSIVEEDNRGDFTYSNITAIAPLCQEYLHYLFEVPAEIENSNGSLTALLTIGGTQYSLVIRDGKEGDVAETNKNATEKKQGAVREGETVFIPNRCEFYVDFSEITEDVCPPQPSDWYSHYVAEDGKLYVDFCIVYKNWKNVPVVADDVISAKLIYAGKYEYTGFSIIEKDSRGDFTYTNITQIAPLATEYIHYLFEIPTTVETDGGSIEIIFTVGDNTYIYTMR